MQEALRLARQGWGQTHPNPMVGAVVVEDGRMVATGYHAKAGAAHAEVAALTSLGRPPKVGATLVITLEPCSTHGRTPPCTEAILASGIRRIVVGAVDPNPAHGGRGLALLREAGLTVTSGVLAEACTDLNLLFNHWITTQRPLLAAKVATTLDAATATRHGESRWITGEAARADVHRWRALFPAIVAGSTTVLADNPSLTARLPEGTTCPRRFIFDRRLRLAAKAARGQPPEVFRDAYARQTTLVVCQETEEKGADSLANLRSRFGIDTWVLPGRLDDSPVGSPASHSASAPNPSTGAFFDAFAQRCAREGLTGVFFESGGSLLRALLQAQALDYLFHYRSPILLADVEAQRAFSGLATASLDQAPRLTDVQHATFGPDQLLRGFLRYPKNPASASAT